MTAAFSVLSREQVNDASPQLTVLQRVGGSLGTAIFAVVLQSQLQHAHTAAAAAAGFGHTYWWVMGVTLLALIPTLLLARIERRDQDRRRDLRRDSRRGATAGGSVSQTASSVAEPAGQVEELRTAVNHLLAADRRLRGRDHSRPGELDLRSDPDDRSPRARARDDRRPARQERRADAGDHHFDPRSARGREHRRAPS